LVGAVILVGQLSVGWSNDWIDADRDALSARPDKPISQGQISRPAVGTAAVVALAATVPLSFALGFGAGLAHVVAVASAWAYNLYLKRTAWSWLPYAVSFGLLPVVVTLSLQQPRPPPLWIVAAGALLGVGAHLTNVLPDLQDDLANGVRGLPHRLGRTAASLCALVALSLASIIVVVGAPGAPSALGWSALTAVAVVLAASCRVALTQDGSRVPFYGTILIAAVDVFLLLGSGSFFTMSPA
jgi:4-hydroxybenzoate polyprenyltransferase